MRRSAQTSVSLKSGEFCSDGSMQGAGEPSRSNSPRNDVVACQSYRKTAGVRSMYPSFVFILSQQ